MHKFRWKYFRWSPINTTVLIVSLGLLIWYLLSQRDFTGFLGIIVLFISRQIMWTGWDKEEIIRLNEEIESLKKQL